MRSFLDAILAFISTASLSDGEWATIDELTDESYTIANYNALLVILDARESISSTRDRLRYYFLARSVEIPTSETGRSNIFVGGSLCS